MKRSYRAKTLYTRKAKTIRGLGDKMGNSKAIVKFVLRDVNYTNPRHNIKMLFDTDMTMEGEIVRCIYYESNSGLHWEKCYIIDKDQWLLTYRGTVRKLKTVAMLAPLTLSDISKPMPREGKNVVKLDVNKYKELQISMLRLMHSILVDNRNILLYANEDVAEVMIVKFFDYRIPGIIIGSQSNLEIYWIANIPRVIKMKKTGKVELSKHVIEFSIPAMVSKAETMITSRYTIEAAIMKVDPGTELRISHPEHGEKKLELNHHRITSLLALHISSRYLE